jgi:hypothetical protein
MPQSTNAATVVVGTRIHSKLYGGRNGVVYAIHGEQSPDSIRSLAMGAIVMGGSAEFDIVFENGTESHRIPEAIMRGVQWEIYAAVADADEIKSLRANVLVEQARRASVEEENRAQFQAEVLRLRKAPEYAHLKQQGATIINSHKLAIQNVRIELKKLFPSVKFSVRSERNSIDITYPKNADLDLDQLKKLSNRYKDGYFDGMEDIYRSTTTAFNTVFGVAKYVSVHEDWREAPSQAQPATD